MDHLGIHYCQMHYEGTIFYLGYTVLFDTLQYQFVIGNYLIMTPLLCHMMSLKVHCVVFGGRNFNPIH